MANLPYPGPCFQRFSLPYLLVSREPKRIVGKQADELGSIDGSVFFSKSPDASNTVDKFRRDRGVLLVLCTGPPVPSGTNWLQDSDTSCACSFQAPRPTEGGAGSGSGIEAPSQACRECSDGVKI